MDDTNNNVTESNSSNSIILSDNINLFQSLRVLQDGELEDESTIGGSQSVATNNQSNVSSKISKFFKSNHFTPKVQNELIYISSL